MSKQYVFTRVDSDASFESAVEDPVEPPRRPSSSSISDASIELIDYVEPPTTDPEGSEANSGPRFAEAIYVDSSSDTGQATMGSSTSSGKKRIIPVSETRVLDLSDSSNSQSEPTASRKMATDPLNQTLSQDTNRPCRRSVSLKSISGATDSSPSQESSIHGTMDKVCISSSAEPNSESSEQLVQEPPLGVPKTRMEQVLQVRLQRMSIEMANLKVEKESKMGRSRKNSNQSETSNGPSPRKLRARTPSTKCLESFNLEDLQLSPRRRTTRTKENRTPKKTPSKSHGDDQDHMSEETPDFLGDEGAMKKSTIICDIDADVAGQKLFSFRTPKKRDGMAQLAAMAPKTPQTPKTPKHVQRRMESHMGTPKSTATRGGQSTKTPSRLRSILKKELSKFTKPDTSGSDFSADDSDEYKPDDNSGDSENSAESDASQTSESSVDKKKRYAPAAVTKTPISERPARQSARKQYDFVTESEDYFNHHTNKKAITSDRTLDRMNTPRLPHDHLFRLLASTTLSAAHEQAIADLHQDYRQNFPKWLFILDEGFSIILHGLGSKRNLLQQFHQDVLADHDVLVVNGFFPSLTIKDVLDSISVDLLGLTISSRNHHEIVDAIAEALAANPAAHVFLIIHNIDGAMLRNDNAQLVLSRLAKINQIHMIASMDHINAPLLWDHIKLSNFNFAWWDVTTMLPYTEETAFENSMMVNHSGGLALSSMKNVFLSLTNNSRGIFLIIVRNQLNNKGNATFQGMPFKDLYSKCRENFLVSSDVALRSQLTEFIDHNLVKMKRTSDGIEHLQIPLDAALLEQFLELQENNM